MSSEGGDSMTNTVYSLLGMSSLDITWHIKVSLHAWQVREMISCNKSNVNINCVHATSTHGIFHSMSVVCSGEGGVGSLLGEIRNIWSTSSGRTT